ncbi:MAG: metalloregulator ArsR/SmtB family transcription factor [Thermoleophilia bacterium]|nr:metalloregulator ArsR/SmtB family transcription factor [Thermoleophilia bacterium]
MRSSIHTRLPKGKSDKEAAGRRKTAESYVCDVECIHPELVEQLEETSLDWETASQLSEIFQAMSDPTRLRIISLLSQHELCVCDIAAALNMTQSAISHQLRVLRLADLVKFRKEGRITWYSLDDEHVERLFQQGISHIAHIAEEDVGAAGNNAPE